MFPILIKNSIIKKINYKTISNAFIRNQSTSLNERIKSLTGDPEVVALVTGGAQGIGLAFVKELLENGVKSITIADIDAKKGKELEKSLSTNGKKVKFVEANVTLATQLEAVFKETVKEFKGLNIVINNAGILNDKNWELEIETNITQFVRGCFLAIKYMGKNNGHKGGIVVNNASILGLQPFAGSPVYTGSKHFVVGLTQSLGTSIYAELTNVEYMAICPGVTNTPLIDEARKFALDILGPATAEELVFGLSNLPNQSVEDCAQHLITILTQSRNGGVWVSEAGETYEVVIPAKISELKAK